MKNTAVIRVKPPVDGFIDPTAPITTTCGCVVHPHLWYGGNDYLYVKVIIPAEHIARFWEKKCCMEAAAPGVHEPLKIHDEKFVVDGQEYGRFSVYNRKIDLSSGWSAARTRLGNRLCFIAASKAAADHIRRQGGCVFKGQNDSEDAVVFDHSELSIQKYGVMDPKVVTLKSEGEEVREHLYLWG